MSLDLDALGSVVHTRVNEYITHEEKKGHIVSVYRAIRKA
jgi:hypothetical protein